MQLPRWFVPRNMKPLGRLVLPAIVAPSLVVAALVIILLWQFKARVDDDVWADHSDQVIETAEQATLALADSRGVVRSHFLNTHRDSSEAFAATMSKVHSDIAHLRALVADNPLQERRLDEIEKSAIA